MRRQCLFALVVSASALLAAPCLADTVIDTYPYWDGNVSDGWYKVAQSFVAPADNVLDSYQFAFAGSNIPLQFDIFVWDQELGPIGASLFTAQRTGHVGDVLIDNIHLTLEEGVRYAAVVDLLGYNGESVHWMMNVTGNPAGDASWWNVTWQYLNSGWSTEFRARFSGSGCPSDFNAIKGGACPNANTISWSGAPVNSSVRVLYTTNNGAGGVIPPNSACPGTRLCIGLAGVTLHSQVLHSNGNGAGSTPNFAAPCGLHIQLITQGSCRTSNRIDL